MTDPVTNPDFMGLPFFEQMCDCREPYRRLGAAIESTLRGEFATVLDIGCGVGHVIKYLTERGHYCHGWDGDPEAQKYSECAELIQIVDLRIPNVLSPAADLVICTETAEHIEAQYANTVVQTVADSAQNTIVWSAAQPEQLWPGHVNLRPPYYWLAKFKPLGFRFDKPSTDKLHSLMLETHAQHEYCVSNFMILRRE